MTPRPRGRSMTSLDRMTRLTMPVCNRRPRCHMIDVAIHYKSNGSIRQRLPAVPGAGSYIEHDSRLWKVDAVVYSEPTATWGRGTIDVYCIEVSEDRASELQA